MKWLGWLWDIICSCLDNWDKWDDFRWLGILIILFNSGNTWYCPSTLNVYSWEATMWSQLGQTSAQKCKAPTVIMKIQNTHRIKIIYKGFLKIDIHIFSSFSSLRPFFPSGSICHRAVNPQHLQIMRIDREGIIDDIIMHQTWRHLCKKTCEKDVVGIVTFVPDWFTFHQAHCCLYNLLQWHTRVFEETFSVKS